MLIKNLICKHINEIDDIFNIYLRYYPILEDYELEKLTQDEINEIYKKYKEKIQKCFEYIKTLEIEKDEDNIVFIVKQQSPEYKSEEISLNSFMCKKDEIEEKIKKDFTLWNGHNETRIEHYCYDTNKIKEIINKEIYMEKSLSEIEVIADIIKSLSSFGWTDEDKEKNLTSFYQDIEEGMKDIEEGRYYTSEEVFEHLEMEILKEMTQDEVKQYFEEKRIKEINKPRDDLYRYIVTRLNHKKCISLIEEYYITHCL